MPTAIAPTADAEFDAPPSVLEQARGLRAMADRAEAGILALACEWADLHPASPGDETAFADEHLPAVAWDAPAEFALALGMSHDAGSRLIRHALHLRHRLPSTWSRAMAAGSAGGLQVWRARRIAEHTLEASPAVTALLDQTLAPMAHRVGPVTLTRLVEEAVLRCHPTEHEHARVAALDTRHVTIRTSDPAGTDLTGVGYLDATAEILDLLQLEDTLAAIATALAEQGCAESLDVRRSLALGVLADPQHAAALLREQPGDTTTATTGQSRKQVVLYVHLGDTAITSARSGAQSGARSGAVGRLENGGHHPMLATQIRDWCSRTDTTLRVQPVIDLNHHVQVNAYEVPDRLKEHIALRDHHCVFPWCSRPARRCDHDHIVPHRPGNTDGTGLTDVTGLTGGRTCDCNLAPLCRRHHRMKTHTRWRYAAIEPGVFPWTSPHGHQTLVDHTGTRDASPRPTSRPTSPPKHDGCHQPDG